MQRTCAVLLMLAAAVLLNAQTASQHIRLDKEPILSNERITIHYSGMPGNSQDWICLVPVTASDRTHGQWFYTRGQTSGTHTFGGVRLGTYEIRVYYDWPRGGYEVQDRLRFTVGEADEPASFLSAAQTPGVWHDPDTRRVPAEPRWRERGADPAAAERVLARLHAMVELIRTTDSIGRPMGFESLSGLEVSLDAPQWMARLTPHRPGPGVSWARVWLYPYFEARDGSVYTDKWFGYIWITENDPAPVYLWGGGCKSLDGEWWFLEPKAIGTAGRFTVYEMMADVRSGSPGNQRAIVITSPDLPEPWLPVTWQEFMDDRARRMELRLEEARRGLERYAEYKRRLEQSLEDLRKAYEQAKERGASSDARSYAGAMQVLEAMINDPEAQEEEARILEAAPQLHAQMEHQISEFRAILDGASTAERNSQAVGSVNYGLPAERNQVIITLPGVPGGSEVRGVVRPNPAIVSQSYSADSVRMLTVHIFSQGWAVLREALDRFLEEFDWEALAALLD